MKEIVLFSITTVDNEIPLTGSTTTAIACAVDWLVQFESTHTRNKVLVHSDAYSYAVVCPEYTTVLLREIKTVTPFVGPLAGIVERTLWCTAKLSISRLILWLDEHFPDQFIYRLNVAYNIKDSNIPIEDQQIFSKYSVPKPGKIAMFRTPQGRIERLS